MDEQECISPTDANQYLFDRARGESSLNRFLSNNEDIQEQDEDDLEFDGKQRRDSENFQFPEVNDIEKAKLMSCMEEVRNIIGDSYSDKRIIDAIMISDYDFSKALDMLLNDISRTQPSRKPKVIEVEKGIYSHNDRVSQFYDKTFDQIVKSSSYKMSSNLTNFSIILLNLF